MKRIYLLAALGILVMPALASAQSPFDGTWKVNMSNVDWSAKPDVFLLQDGMYQCKTCIPPVNIKADGEQQKITGDPYRDSTAVKVVSDHEIEGTDMKNGKVVGTNKLTVSPGGNTLTFEWTAVSAANGATTNGKGEETRVAPGPAGSNAISGSWRMKKMADISKDAITFTYKVKGDEITMTNPTGQTYTAKMAGAEAPMKGDPGITTVSVKKLGKSTMEETDKRDGKVIGVMKLTVQPDGKMGNVIYQDKLQGTTTKFTVTKE